MPEATPAPFVDVAVGDVDAASTLAGRAARSWDLPAPRLVRVGMNALFACGDVVLRVGRPNAAPDAAIDLAVTLAAHGIATTRPVRTDVVVDGALAVTAWERLRSTGEPVDWAAAGGQIARIHDLDVSLIPERYPVSSPARFAWWDFDRMLADVADVLDLPANRPARDGLLAAVDRGRGWERFDETVVCHGDVHPGNVVQCAGGPVLIDWDLLCRAPRGWDHAPMMTWEARWGGSAGGYDAFAAGYGASFRGDPDAEAFAELRLVAATLMRLVAARTDLAATVEAERRLRYWAGDPNAPDWVAQ